MAVGRSSEKWAVFVFCPDCPEEAELIVEDVDEIEEAEPCPCGSGFVVYRIAEYRDA